jgi:hypothetical protein
LRVTLMSSISPGCSIGFICYLGVGQFQISHWFYSFTPRVKKIT